MAATSSPGGPVVAAISGPGDQLWQLQVVRGTSCGSYKRSGGPVVAAISGSGRPVVAAISGPGDQLWQS